MTIKKLKELYNLCTITNDQFGYCDKPSWSVIALANREGRLIADATNGYIKTVSNNPHESYALMVKIKE